MLRELHIKDFAIIERAEIEFGTGLNVLTGETGAGKSIIIDALELVLGERSKGNEIRQGAGKAEVYALFSLPSMSVKRLLDEQDILIEEEIILKRSISRSGKNRCFVNGSLVTRSFLKQIGVMLVDIHGQHEHQSLLDKSSHIDMFDLCTGILQEKEKLYSIYDRYKVLIDEFIEHSRVLKEQKEQKIYLNMTVEEISQSNISEEEEDNLQHELTKLANAERLLNAAQTGYAALYTDDDSVLSRLKRTLKVIHDASLLDSNFTACEQSINNAIIELEDAALGLRDYSSEAFSPDRMEEIKNRLEEISSLKRKYKAKDTAGLISIKNEALEKLAGIDSDTEKIEVLKKEITSMKKILSLKMTELDDKRRAKSKAFEKAIEKELHDLNMPSVIFRVNFTLNSDNVNNGISAEDEHYFLEYDGSMHRISRNGFSKVEFLFSSSFGVSPSPLNKIASGGEVSRLMLVLKKMLAHNDSIPTMIFDEIDTGTGGESADMIGLKLKDAAKTHQVICITHLPHIAGKADVHFKIYKKIDGKCAKTLVTRLNQKDRVMELARMSGGRIITRTTVEHAKEMMGEN